MLGTSRGTPPSVRSPAGYVVPTACGPSDEVVGEVIVTLTKTGIAGGRLRGLRLTYESNGRLQQMAVDFRFSLCGTAPPAPRCRATEA